MNIKGIIFDLDGVLVFTDKYHYKAWKAVADELGVYFDETINNRLRGVSRMASLDIILERYEGRPLSAGEKAVIAEKKNGLYRQLLAEMTPADVSEEVRDTLKELRGRGCRIALGSSSKNARFILERTDLTDAFDAISDGNNITHSKPDPEVFVKAAEYLHLAPADCLVVEDAQAGIEAAIAGGMHSAAIGDAVHCGLAEYTLGSIVELLQIV